MEPLQCKITNSGGRIKRLSKRFKTAPFYFYFANILLGNLNFLYPKYKRYILEDIYLSGRLPLV